MNASYSSEKHLLDSNNTKKTQTQLRHLCKPDRHRFESTWAHESKDRHLGPNKRPQKADSFSHAVQTCWICWWYVWFGSQTFQLWPPNLSYPTLSKLLNDLYRVISDFWQSNLKTFKDPHLLTFFQCVPSGLLFTIIITMTCVVI